MRDRYDVIVIGAGPAGSASAMLLAERGLAVLLVERDAFPRYHIGESLTGTAGDFLSRYGFDDELRRLDFPAKPGVLVFGREAKHEFYVPVLRPTWQVRRAEFDDMLLRRAIAAGAEHQQRAAKHLIVEQGRVVGVVLDEGGGERRVACRMLVDASGQAVLSSREGVAGPRRVSAFNRQIALYSQFTGVRGETGERANTTILLYRDTYHWAWMIPISSTLTSIGIVLPTSSYKLRGGTAEAAMRWGLAELNPELAARVAGATQTEGMQVSRNYSYRVDPFVGPGFLCVGDSHCFTDPIFSFGVSFALTEAQAAVGTIVGALDQPAREAELLDAYARYCDRGQSRAADLIRYFWKFPAFFAYMTRSELGADVIRLLAGDCFSEEALPASVEMRRSLEESPAIEQVPAGRARAIAARIYERFDFFQGVDAAYLDPSEGVIRIYFVLSEDDIDLYDSLRDFEEQLIEDFGRDDLAVLSFTPDLLDALPSLDAAFRIFDRRPDRRPR